MKEVEHYIIALIILIITAIGKALDEMKKKNVHTKLGIATSLLLSIIGGIISGMLSQVYIETLQIQWVCVSVGAWLGGKMLDKVADAFDKKLSLILNNNKNE